MHYGNVFIYTVKSLLLDIKYSVLDPVDFNADPD